MANDRLRYVERAMAYARQHRLTPEQAAGMSYADTAKAAGITIGRDGRSPPDFFYRHVRQQVASVLHGEREQVRREAVRAAMQEGARRLAGEQDTEVEFDEAIAMFRVSSIRRGVGREVSRGVR